MRRALAAAAVATLAAAVPIRLLGEQPTLAAVNGTCNVLALSGGGSFGAVEMGILDGLLGSGAASSQYDIITGISAGGLNAAFLSYYADVGTALPDIYGILANLTTAQVYKSAFWDIFSGWSIYNNAPLEATLGGILANKPAAAGGPVTLIGATNVNSETLDVFRFDLLDLQDRIDVLMSTSAIPLAFPPRVINGSTYVDGGVINNEMISQAMGMKECGSYNFVFISASSRGERQVIDGFFSYVSAVGHVLLDTFDYQIAQYETVKCMYPKGYINACFPTAPELENYSILNFDYGAQLYALGKSSYNCSMLEIC
jgi:predicted acylesterase/phospholipase RssA